MKNISIATLVLGAASCALGQGGNVMYQASGTTVSVGAFQKGPATPITGAPYSGTITNEMTQTLEDGTHIAQTMNGNVARDSAGRTRQDAPLPEIGNLSAANAPHIVFVQDPVAQVSYTLDLTNKTAQKVPAPSVPAMGVTGAAGGPGEGPVFAMRLRNGSAAAPAGAMQIPDVPPPPGMIMMRQLVNDDSAQVTTEDLGSQTMQGVTVTGTRTTHVIPAGQIGNDAPITITNEVWTSPDLKTVVYSKRNDPRMGVQTFQLTNITRTDPDPSLFTVPPDFKVVDGPQPIVYRTNQ
jgi:hypothetical protein